MAHIKDKFGIKINNNMLGKLVLVYLFIFLFTLGNLLCFYQDNQISLMEFKVSNKIQLICYERMELKTIRTMVNKSRTLRQLNLDYSAIKISKNEEKRRRGGAVKVAARNALDFRYVNFSNLRQVTLTKGQFLEETIKYWTKFGFSNVQSLKHKKNLLRDYLVNQDIGLFLAMETWLKSDIESQVQIQGSALNMDGYTISVANRETGSRGGEFALIHMDTLDCSLLDKRHAHTFKHTHWEILGCNMTLSLLALYHPPPSPKLQNMISEFVTEFVDFLADKLNNHTGDLIIASDFNIHVNDLLADDAQQLLSEMEALGCDRLVDFCTHKSGNILDLLFTCIGNQIKCINIKSDGFISDHCFIQAQ